MRLRRSDQTHGQPVNALAIFWELAVNAQAKLAKVQEAQDLAARAAPMFLKTIPIDGN